MFYQVTIPILPNLPENTILSIGNYVSSIVGVALTIAAIAAFLFLAWGGIQWITAGGDKGKIEEARNRITGAVIGLAIVAVSWALFLVLDSFFGLGIAGKSGSTPDSGDGGTGGGSTRGVCLYPTSRCCDDVNNTSCFCQNPNYTTATYGSCNAGGGQTGILCDCVPR